MMYDAFLSYNTKDRDAVEAIALYLKDKAGLKVFFDRWEMIPGSPVQETLEKALAESAVCVVFIGPSGLGIYQNEETRIALEKSISKKDIRVIPVLLPGGKRQTKESELPPFLRRLSWLEFGDDPLDPESLRRLVCGIKNLIPGPGAKPLIQPTGICPYRGLEVFREQDRDFFFGRESLVQRLMARLKNHRFLAFIGPSGSGKSSVLQAGLIPLLHSGSLIALFTPRERPLEELAMAMRLAAAPVQIQYSTAQIIDQLHHSADSLHYLAREILQAHPGDGAISVRRLVVIVDQLEEIFTLTQSEPERRQFISLLLRAVEMLGGPVTVILAMRSDFIGKCAPYRDLNIYFSEHLEQVEPMTRFELQSAIESPAQTVGLEFEEGLVGVMLEDVKGSGSELPLIGHALWELYHYQPRLGNLLTAQAYEAIGRIEGALVRRAESLYNGLTTQQQGTLRKMFLLGLIQPGEGAPDTRRRAMKEELLTIGSDAEAAEKLIYELATTRLLTVGRDEAAGQETVEVAHEALIRNWGRIGEWMAEGREMARQRGLLRQAAREWDKNGKNPEYLFQGTRLAQMEEFVTVHEQDLGNLENAFIAAGTAEREAQRRKKRRNLQKIIGLLIAVLLVVTYSWYQADRSEKKALKQLAVNYWDTAKRMREDNDRLKSLHLFCEVLTIEKDKKCRESLLIDMNGLWQTAPLLHIFPHEKTIHGARFSKDGNRILTWSEDDNKKGTARLWDASTGKPIGEVMKHEKGVNGAIFNKDETRILTWSGKYESENDTARLWDAATCTPIGEDMKHEDNLSGPIFIQNDTLILTWRKNGTSQLWDAVTGKLIGETIKHKARVYNAIFNWSKTRIIIWSEDSTTWHWRAPTSSPVSTGMKHEEIVNFAIFNQDKTRILTFSDGYLQKNGTARLWDATTGKPIGEVMKHEGSVYGGIFNQDGTRILTLSKEYNSMNINACLWDAATGKPIGEVMKHDDPLYNAIFSKDRTRILTWTRNYRTWQLWDAVTGKPIGKVMKFYGEVDSAILNKDGTRILTWSYNGPVRLWDANTGKPIGEVMKLESMVWKASFNKDETRILAFCLDGTARLWDATTGRSTGEVMKHKSGLRGAVFNRNENRILTWSWDGTARLWDVVFGKPICEVMKQRVKDVIFNQYGTRIFTRNEDCTASIWDANTGKPIGEAMKHNLEVNGAKFSKDGTRILTWSEDNTARLWDATTSKPIGGVMKHDEAVRGAIFNKKGTRILTWCGGDTIPILGEDFTEIIYAVRLWDASSGKSTGAFMKHENIVNGAIFNKNETRILTWSDDGTARLWSAATGTPIGEVMKHEGRVYSAKFNKDETRILTLSGEKYLINNTARLWDATTGKPIGEVMKHESDVIGAIFNKKGTRILTWSEDNTARLWDATTGKPIGEIMKHKDAVLEAIFNHDETRILTRSGDGTARLWDAFTGKSMAEVMKHDGWVKGVIFNQDETFILTWSGDNYSNNHIARIWDATTGRPIGSVMRHEDEINGAIFNKDGSGVLTWSNDGTARFWDAATGKQIGEIMKHEGAVWKATFNKDETRILTGSSYRIKENGTVLRTKESGTVRLWDIAIDPDFPMEYIKLQTMAITGTSYDTSTNTITVLLPEEWRKIKEQYMEIAARHYRSCRYPEGNVFRKLFPKEAEKIKREKVR